MFALVAVVAVNKLVADAGSNAVASVGRALAAGVDVNAVCEAGDAALHRAILRNHVDMVVLLLSHGRVGARWL